MVTCMSVGGVDVGGYICVGVDADTKQNSEFLKQYATTFIFSENLLHLVLPPITYETPLLEQY